jgi:hypothetical protein
MEIHNNCCQQRHNSQNKDKILKFYKRSLQIWKLFFGNNNNNNIVFLSDVWLVETNILQQLQWCNHRRYFEYTVTGTIVIQLHLCICSQAATLHMTCKCSFKIALWMIFQTYPGMNMDK